MTFDEWLALSAEDREAAQARWNHYSGPGEWWDILNEATDRFRAEFASCPRVLSVVNGIFADGRLIIGVDIAGPGYVWDIPMYYLGFRFRQFWTPPTEHWTATGR